MASDTKYDDPVTMASNLLTQMKELGIECEVPPNQLRTGYGVPVCSVLLALVNFALSSKKFGFKRAAFDEFKKAKESAEIDDEPPDLIKAEIDYGEEATGEEKKKEKETKEEEDDGTNILFSGTDAEDWHRELEKVSNKLKIDYKSLNPNGNSEWRAHINKIKEGGDKFALAIPDTRAALENLSSQIDKSIEKITKKEEVLSKNHENIIANYKEKHKSSSNQFDEYKKLNEEVEQLKVENETLSEKIAQEDEEYDKKSKKINDTSALANTKNAITNIQNESVTLDMNINILNHSLLKYSLESDLMKMSGAGSVDVSVGGADSSMFEDVM